MEPITDIAAYMAGLGQAARAASRLTAAASTAAKDAALLEMARQIRLQQEVLLAANARDLAEARANGLEAAMIDRLTLSAKSIEAMAQGLEQVAALPDPVGEITDVKFSIFSEPAELACSSRASNSLKMRCGPASKNNAESLLLAGACAAIIRYMVIVSSWVTSA